MKKLQQLLKKDKVLHITAGFIIAAVFTAAFGPAIGLAVGVAAGFGKEFYDKYIKKTEFSALDLYATIVGAAVGMFATMAIIMYIL